LGRWRSGSNGGGGSYRLKAMLAQRRLWAEQQGLNPKVVEKLFNDLVKYFIAEEMKHWEGSPS
jgi:isochorismate pyruvate lyase